jgi:tetratricopeptide (TPR) repeat protein
MIIRHIQDGLRALIAGFKLAFWNLGALVLVAYLALASPLIWLLGHRQLDDQTLTPIYYLLSAQAQVLVTILGLVFTTTVVAAQLATRYSQRALRHVLGAWVFYYFVPYLAGIALPLFLLHTNLALWVERVSLLLGGFCLALLIPYFVVLRRRLSLDSLIQVMENEMAASDLLNLAMGALQNYDYTTFEEALDAVQKVGVQKVGEDIISRVKEDSLASLRSNLVRVARRELRDPRAPFKAINILRELGYAAVQARLEDETKQFWEDLYEVGKEAIQKDIPDVAGYAVGAIGLLGEAAIKNKLWGALKDGRTDEQGVYIIIKQLRDISKMAADKLMDEVVQHTGFVLSNLAHTAISFTATEEPDVKERPSRLAKKAAEAMGQVAEGAIGKISEDIINQFVNKLCEVGFEAIQAELGSVGHQAISSLQQVYCVAHQDGQEAVLRSIIWAYGQLAKATSQSRKGGKMLSRIIKYLSDAAKNAVQQRRPVWEQTELATSIGYAGQAALNSGDIQNAKLCYESLKDLAAGIINASETQGFPEGIDIWAREKAEGVGFRVATGLGFIAQEAARRQINEMIEGSIDLLEKLSQAANKAKGWDTVRQVELAMGYIAQALLEKPKSS